MSERRPILLLNGVTREPVEAALIEGVTLAEIQAADAAWLPFLRTVVQQARLSGVPPEDLPEHGHWRWERKWRAATGASRFFGVESGGDIQGLMAVRLDKTCRLPEQAGQPLVYVDYLAAAPWNDAPMLARIAQAPRLSRVGSVLLQGAVHLSLSQGWRGRLGLHGLPQAARFYREICGMTDLGTDAAYEGLPYFEMTVEQAARLIGGGTQ